MSYPVLLTLTHWNPKPHRDLPRKRGETRFHLEPQLQTLRLLLHPVEVPLLPHPWAVSPPNVDLIWLLQLMPRQLELLLQPIQSSPQTHVLFRWLLQHFLTGLEELHLPLGLHLSMFADILGTLL